MPKEYKKKGRGRPKKKKNEGKPKKGNYVIRADGKCDTGRETKYKPEYPEQTFKLCLLGKTDIEIAEFFNISERTLYYWKEIYPDFLQAFIDGRDKADSEVANSLYKRATGITFKERKVVQKPDGIETTITEKFIAPDTRACEIWLTVRTMQQMNRWMRLRNEEPKIKDSTEMTENEENKEMTAEEASQQYRDFIKKTNGEQV